MKKRMMAMFYDMPRLLKKLKRKVYEENMVYFRKTYGALLEDMVHLVAQDEQPERVANELAEELIQGVRERFAPKGRVGANTQIDLNLFMIYYVFPGLLFIPGENASLLAETICQKWRASFAKSEIRYFPYEEIRDGFKEKIFGIF